MTKVAIIHPWFPQYREALFREIVRVGQDRGVQVDIYHGEVPPDWKARGDESRLNISQQLHTRFVKSGGKYIVWKSLKRLRPIDQYDLIVLEHAVRNVESYLVMIRMKGKFAFWGHGRSYTSNTGRLHESVKTGMLRWARGFLAYTNGGRDSVVQAGMQPQSVTVVHNAIDTLEFSRDLHAVPASIHTEVGHYLFVGALDEGKRLHYLIESFERAHEIDDRTKLTIAGDGPLRAYVESQAATRPWLTYAGRTTGEQKATLFRRAYAVAMPGRVGLVAVDAFVAALPVVTTDWKYHAPEFEYLQNEQNAVITADRIEEYVQAIVRLNSDTSRRDRLSIGAHTSSSQYSTEACASNIVEGIINLLDSPSPDLMENMVTS